jgi:large subunit ribosomal protein L10
VNRAEKAAAVDKLAILFRESPHVVLAGFSGLTVGQATELRRRIRQAGGSYQVLKNRLAKRAAQGTPVERLSPRFTGPRALAAHRTDPLALVKVLTDFAADNPQLEVVGAVVDARDLLGPAEVKALASLPGLPQLRARVLYLAMAPATTLARTLAEPARRLAAVMEARRRQLEEGVGSAT